jgi:septal ring factor EnvC (AmiA/AmiB activator)
MKLWKYLIGLVAAIGGIIALSSSKNKKKLDKQVKQNEEKLKVVKAKTEVVEQQKSEVKKKIAKSKIKAKTLNEHLKDTSKTQDIIEDFEKKHRKRGRPSKKKA